RPRRRRSSPPGGRRGPAARPEPPMRATRLAPLALVLPSVLLVLVFVYGFIAWTAWLSLSNANDLVVSQVRLVGFANYQHLAELPRFRIDLGNTVTFSLAFIAGCLGLGLGGALLINSAVRLEGLWRTVYLMPMALSFIVTGVVWRWLMNPSTGLNLLLDGAGLGALQSGWVTHPRVPANGSASPADS